jgi:hypothetical protein
VKLGSEGQKSHSPSNVDYRHKTDEVIEGHGSHTKRQNTQRRIGKGKET